jgi:AcrR family transcriptional regulator
MARIAGRNAERTELDIRQAATRLVARHGFEGMNLRMLAREIGVKAGSIYNHIESKEALLHSLLVDTMREALAGLDAALAGATDPLDALRRYVAFHIEFHAVRRDAVFIGNAELRSLSAAHFAGVVAMRNAYEQRLCDVLRRGEAAGVFRPGDVRVAASALIAMMSGVCTWYRAAGRLDVADLVVQYTRMVLGSVGVEPDAPIAAAPVKRPRASAARSRAARSRP